MSSHSYMPTKLGIAVIDDSVVFDQVLVGGGGSIKGHWISRHF